MMFTSEQLSLEMRIKDFVREEVARQLSIVPFVQQPTPSCLPIALQNTIREQVAEALPPTRQPTTAPAPLAVPPVATVVPHVTSPATVTAPLTYADCVARPAHPLVYANGARADSTTFSSARRLQPGLKIA